MRYNEGSKIKEILSLEAYSIIGITLWEHISFGIINLSKPSYKKNVSIEEHNPKPIGLIISL